MYYSCDGKAEFWTAITPVPHDPSEIRKRFGAQTTFLIIINVEKSCSAVLSDPKVLIILTTHFQPNLFSETGLRPGQPGVGL